MVEPRQEKFGGFLTKFNLRTYIPTILLQIFTQRNEGIPCKHFTECF